MVNRQMEWHLQSIVENKGLDVKIILPLWPFFFKTICGICGRASKESKNVNKRVEHDWATELTDWSIYGIDWWVGRYREMDEKKNKQIGRQANDWMNGWNKWKDRILQTGFQSNIEVRFISWLCFLIPCPILFCLYSHSSVQIHPNFFTSCC